MGFYGKWTTWKITYYPKVMDGGIRGVAFVEAGDRSHAIYVFSKQYEGQYFTIESVTQLGF